MAEVTNSKLLHIDTGILKVQDACIVLVKTEWNAAIVDELKKDASLNYRNTAFKRSSRLPFPALLKFHLA
ncbi:MAG: hypothetical protein WDO16_07655 [Bacteroidota bacterium]